MPKVIPKGTESTLYLIANQIFIWYHLKMVSYRYHILYPSDNPHNFIDSIYLVLWYHKGKIFLVV